MSAYHPGPRHPQTRLSNHMCYSPSQLRNHTFLFTPCPMSIHCGRFGLSEEQQG
ncbi:hypothetical protein LZ30DRAFT_697528 [Colletotrichum cereale]|nr:hypothetical protein LZ30DRAFT_697528 [Colletotrichum cereale]